MVEESVESFISQYRPYAASVELLPRLEGSTLLECVVAGTVIHLLERTNPYLAQPGSAQVIINPMTEQLEPSEATRKEITSVALGQLRAVGRVLEQGGDTAVIDAGVPLVVSGFAALETPVATGAWVSFTSLAPVHGFVVPRRKSTMMRRESEGDSI